MIKQLIFIGALAGIAASSQAVTLVLEVDLSGAATYGDYGYPLNFNQTINLDSYFGANYSDYTLTGLGYDVEFATDGLSSLNEVVFSLETTGAASFFDNQLFPTSNFSGVASLDSLGAFGLPLPGTIAGGGSTGFTVLPDDNVKVLIWETFNDGDSARDGIFRDGSKAYVRFEAVPEPASMVALGLGVATLLRRRKK